jgi:hypothetical protein
VSWDVRSNIKAKPGSQGTLFQGGSDQMTDAKWPRGYTPERLHQVREAVAPGREVFPDEPYMKSYDTNGDTRKLIDNIARSTVPGAHLNRVQFSAGKSKAQMTVGSGDSEMTAGGLYTRPPSDDGPRGVGRIRVLKGVADDPVAIHEIGHHASHLAGPPALVTKTDLGREEGKADAYAETHFRDRRGRQISDNGYRYTEPNSERNAEFFASYHATRPRTPEFAPYKPDPHLPGLDAATVYKAGRKQRPT